MGKNDNLRYFEFIENYIYLHHLGTFVILPVWPQTISDSTTVKYSQSSPLSRSAPIYSYSSSGPRSIQFDFEFHRDMFNHMNYEAGTMAIDIGDDYVDTAIKHLQACALPSYALSSKMVDPPMVSVRIGNELFIKGVVDGVVGVDYQLPLLNTNKYAIVKVKFQVHEIDPYDAQSVSELGGFRLLDQSLERNIFKNNTTSAAPSYVASRSGINV
jgi:hypothetical protein